MDMEVFDPPPDLVYTPESSPENSDAGVIIFDPSLWVD